MIRIVIADTGPLIALASSGYLQLLHVLHKEIIIHPAVHAVLCLGTGRSGSKPLIDAIDKGWLKIKKPLDSTASTLSELALILDLGEAEAIVLAEVGYRISADLIREIARLAGE